MSELRATPGPWKIYKSGDGKIDSIRSKIETVACADDLFEFSEANAHLIAAAPELYEALEQMIEAMVLYEMDVDGDVPQRHRDLMRRTRAALKKARGE